jgi:hypothetical protein
MKKTLAKVSLVTPLFLISIWLVLAFNSDEPAYRGKKLTVWLEKLVKVEEAALTSRKPMPDLRQACEALDELGTNSVPFLVRLLCKKPSRLKTEVNRHLSKQSLIKFRFRPEPDYRKLACTAIRALGPRARTAVPELLRIFAHQSAEKPEDSLHLALTLSNTRLQADSEFIAALSHEDKWIRIGAATCLSKRVGGSAAVPALRRALDDPCEDVRRRAAYTLRSIAGAEVDVLVIPVLIGSLQSTNPQARKEGAGALEDLRGAAGPAVPALIAALKDPDAGVRRQAASALLTIDSSAAHEAGVERWNKAFFPRFSIRILDLTCERDGTAPARSDRN